MHLVILAVLFCLLTVRLGMAQCPIVAGVVLPCTSQEQPPAPPSAPPMPALPDPLFRAEQLAPDALPEWLTLLNEPTWDHAVQFVKVEMYRQYRFEIALRLWQAAHQAIIADLEQQTSLSLTANRFAFLQAFVRQWGLPPTDISTLPAAPPTPAVSDIPRLLSEALNGGSPYVATPKP